MHIGSVVRKVRTSSSCAASSTVASSWTFNPIMQIRSIVKGREGSEIAFSRGEEVLAREGSRACVVGPGCSGVAREDHMRGSAASGARVAAWSSSDWVSLRTCLDADV